MIICPTMGRPEKLERFVKAYKDTGGTLPIHVVFDAQDAYRYNEVQTPEHWVRCSVPAGTRLGDIFNLIFKKFPDEDYYGMVADDVIPETLIWDVILSQVCQPNKIAWGFDGIQNEKLPVHPFIGGDLVRALGFWAAPGIKHWFVDNAWYQIALALNCDVYLPQLRMMHHHPSIGKGRVDRTYENQPSHKADEYAFINFMQTQFPEIIERLKNNAHSSSAGSIRSS